MSEEEKVDAAATIGLPLMGCLPGLVVIWALANYGCEQTSDPAQEVLYGPCGHSDECGWSLMCLASDYGGDEGYCTQTCYRTADADIVSGTCAYVDVCGSGCCRINYTVSGGAYGYCVPYP